MHHNPGPFPKLHQLRFKLFFLQLLFKFFWLFTFFSSLISFHAPVDHNAGPLPALGVHLERVLDVVVRVAVVPHHVRLQLVLQEKHLKAEYRPLLFVFRECINRPFCPGGRGTKGSQENHCFFSQSSNPTSKGKTKECKV